MSAAEALGIPELRTTASTGTVGEPEHAIVLAILVCRSCLRLVGSSHLWLNF